MACNNFFAAGSGRRRAYSMALYVSAIALVAACSDDHPESVGATSPFTRIIDPSGCVIERLTVSDHEQYQTQSLSADGRVLAVVSRIGEDGAPDTQYRVYELNLETGETVDLSPALENAGPYSPDGRYMVTAQYAGEGRTDIYEYDRASRELRAIAPHEQWDWLPGYSPDGRYIAFNSHRADDQSEIHLYDKSTGDLQRLTNYAGYDAHAQFSPDGSKILFHRQQGRRDDGGYIFDLVVHDLESGEETQLTSGSHEQGYPAWAPDGQHIVFSSDVDGAPTKPNLYVLGADGTTRSRLTAGIWKDSYSVWSRDGRYIYFNSDRGGTTDVYRVVMDGLDCERAAD